MLIRLLFTTIFLFNFLVYSLAQTIAVGSLRDEVARTMQLMGKLDSSISFTVRPLTISDSKGYAGIKKNIFKPKFALLPVDWIQQYNSKLPYGWNDGAMIQSVGYQTFFRMGAYMKMGPLEVQLNPEAIYASNNDYQTNGLYGTKIPSYTKLFPGQSKISLTHGAFSVGVSTENLWWGPGTRSSLLMSNNAPGFLHGFFRSARPAKTFIGSFEWQLLFGNLSSDSSLPFENINLRKRKITESSRYLSSMVLTYQPKWVKGLFVGITRSIQFYPSDWEIPPNSFVDKYIPILKLAIQKKNVINEDVKNRDQLASFFVRWVFLKSKFEIYGEYGWNDYGINFRDYALSPTHSAAYIVGFKKIVAINKSAYLNINGELTQMSESPDLLTRGAGNWYEHTPIIEGYTNNNQIMGAGFGFGSNLVFLKTEWVKNKQTMGILLEKIIRNPNYYRPYWTDQSIGILFRKDFQQWKLNIILQGISSTNAIWLQGNNLFNLHTVAGVTYFLK